MWYFGQQIKCFENVVKLTRVSKGANVSIFLCADLQTQLGAYGEAELWQRREECKCKQGNIGCKQQRRITQSTVDIHCYIVAAAVVVVLAVVLEVAIEAETATTSAVVVEVPTPQIWHAVSFLRLTYCLVISTRLDTNARWPCFYVLFSFLYFK